MKHGYLHCSVEAPTKLKPLYYNLWKIYDAFSQFYSIGKILMEYYIWRH